MAPEMALALKVVLEGLAICMQNGLTREQLDDEINTIEKQFARKDTLMNVLEESE